MAAGSPDAERIRFRRRTASATSCARYRQYVGYVRGTQLPDAQQRAAAHCALLANARQLFASGLTCFVACELQSAGSGGHRGSVRCTQPAHSPIITAASRGKEGSRALALPSHADPVAPWSSARARGWPPKPWTSRTMTQGTDLAGRCRTFSESDGTDQTHTASNQMYRPTEASAVGRDGNRKEPKWQDSSKRAKRRSRSLWTTAGSGTRICRPRSPH
ncbi:DUF7373 family lipoprotein [Nocardia pneumoniae]|uniref:DUF7373 family lipoprotein n=1 Tax=Nocardia pneumoniae TaxID=228601 RepID=UPI00402B9DCE